LSLRMVMPTFASNLAIAIERVSSRRLCRHMDPPTDDAKTSPDRSTCWSTVLTKDLDDGELMCCHCAWLCPPLRPIWQFPTAVPFLLGCENLAGQINVLEHSFDQGETELLLEIAKLDAKVGITMRSHRQSVDPCDDRVSDYSHAQ
jgi:hypothetical protein